MSKMGKLMGFGRFCQKKPEIGQGPPNAAEMPQSLFHSGKKALGKEIFPFFRQPFVKRLLGNLRLLPQNAGQGRLDVRKSLLIALLAIALTTIALSVYANNNMECIIGCDSNEACKANCLNKEEYVVIENIDGNCGIICGTDLECNDNDTNTTDVCENKGTCDSYCTSIQGTPECTITCSNDLECDDNNTSTMDTCSNAGTCDSNCTNIETQPPCGIICGSDLECNDNDTNTMDVCENRETCDSYCTSIQGIPECTIICNNDAECDDNDANTMDACENAGICGAGCSNTKEEVEAYVVIENAGDTPTADQNAADFPEESGQEMISDAALEELVKNGSSKKIFDKQSAGKELGTLRQLFSEINLLSDNPNITIENEFITPAKSPKIKNLGSDERVKQKLVITNSSAADQNATIAIELLTGFEKFKKTDEEFTAGDSAKKWKAAKNKAIFIMDDENQTQIETETIVNAYIQFTETDGYFDWQDMVDANANPTVFAQKKGNETKITLATAITLKANQTITIDPTYDLNVARAGATNFSARWDGAVASDFLGYTNGSDLGVQFVNADGGSYANDLLITAYSADVMGTDNGAVYLIKNIDTASGTKILNGDTNYDARWAGGTTATTDNLGYTSNSGLGVQLVNADGGAYTNDLILTAIYANTQGVTDNGAVYLIKNIDSLSGTKILNGDTNYDARWAGGTTTDNLGNTSVSGLGVQLVNVDGGSYTNDLLLTAYLANVMGTNNGAVYLIKNIDSLSGTKILNGDTNYDARWAGGTTATADFLGTTVASGLGVQLANVDGGSYANDLLLTAAYANTQGVADNGAVYLIKSIDSVSGTKLLDGDANYDTAWTGASAGDFLGSTSSSGLGVQLINVDGGAYTNDLLLTAYTALNWGVLNIGAVYLERDLMNLTPPDVNVAKIDGYADNGAFPAFSYARDGNLTIDFNVMDVNNDRLRVDINYSTAKTVGSGTVIVRDLNLATLVCPSQDWDTNASQCHWDWNISGVADGNYYINIMVMDWSSYDFNASDNNFLVDNTIPKTYLRVPLNGSTVAAQTVTFDVNKLHHSDINISSIKAGINGATSGVFNASTHCTASDGNYACSYTETGIAAGSNTIDVNASDNAGNAADMNISTFTYSLPDSCSCPASGNWEITSGDVCTLASECNLTGGDLHIVSGRLTIISGGTLAVPAGKKIIVEKTGGAKLVVQKGGKVVLKK